MLLFFTIWNILPDDLNFWRKIRTLFSFIAWYFALFCSMATSKGLTDWGLTQY